MPCAIYHGVLTAFPLQYSKRICFLQGPMLQPFFFPKVWGRYWWYMVNTLLAFFSDDTTDICAFLFLYMYHFPQDCTITCWLMRPFHVLTCHLSWGLWETQSWDLNSIQWVSITTGNLKSLTPIAFSLSVLIRLLFHRWKKLLFYAITGTSERSDFAIINGCIDWSLLIKKPSSSKERWSTWIL